MFDSRGRSIDPRFGANVLRSDGGRGEHAKRFRYTITWTSLTAHLELRCANELMPAAAAGKAVQGVKPASLVALAGVAPPPRILRPETRSDSIGRWEMVVPKMVRADRVSPPLNEAAPFANYRNGDVYPPISIPMFASLGNPSSPFLSRALSSIGRRTRSLLAGPAKPIDRSRLDSPWFSLANGRASRSQVLQLNAPSSPIPAENQIAKNGDIEGRHALRELLLSKVTSTLRGHSRSANSTFESGGAVVESPDKAGTRESVLL